MGSEQLVATAPQQIGTIARHPLRCHVEQRRLADARLAGNEDDLSFAGRGLLQCAVQLLQASRPPNPPLRARDSRRGRGVLVARTSGVGRRHHGHGRDQPVAAPDHRLDISGRMPVVIEDRSKRVDRNAQARLAHMQIGPDRIEQLVLRHQFSGAVEQTAQQFEGFRCQIDAFVATPQQGVTSVNAKRPERNLDASHGCWPSQSA